MSGSLARRLTLLNATVVALTSAGVVALMVGLTHRYMQQHVEESVLAELDVLVADYRIDGLDGVTGFIDIREDFRTPQHGRVYRLENAAGERLAGAWPHWPAALGPGGGLIHVPNLERQPPTEWLMAAAELPDGSRVLVGFDTIESRAVMADVYRAAGIGLAAALLLSLAVGAGIHRAALRPIATIRGSAERIIDGDLGHRIPAGSAEDEFGALAHTLNRMLERIDRLVEGLRGTTDAIAHDLRSPLARHRARLEAALRDPPSAAQFDDWLHESLAEIDRVLGTFQALLQLATVEAGVMRGSLQLLDWGAVLHDAVSLYEPEAQQRQMTLSLDTALPPANVRGDRHLLFQAVINLIDNALKYGPPGQTVRLQLFSEGPYWCLDVVDEGHGIAEPERAFERLSRGERARQTPGYGLGLTLVRAIAHLHEGDVRVLPAAVGSHFRLRLPRAATPIPERASA